jgi:chorismate synthase
MAGSTFGKLYRVTTWGESHGRGIGCVIDGPPSGFKIDEAQLRHDMEQRRSVNALSTGRSEPDEVEFLSGVKDMVTEGTPVALVIRNTNVRRGDYEELRYLARPGHADYTAELRYKGFQDASGGGHFSGRITAPLTAAGSILRQMLEKKGIFIGFFIDFYIIPDLIKSDRLNLIDIRLYRNYIFCRGKCIKAYAKCEQEGNKAIRA